MAFAQLYLCCWLKFGSRKEQKKTTIRPKKGSRTSKAITEGGIFVCDKNLRKTSTQTCQKRVTAMLGRGWHVIGFSCVSVGVFEGGGENTCAVHFVLFYDSRSFQICAKKICQPLDHRLLMDHFFCWGFSCTTFKWEWIQSPSGATSLRLMMQKSLKTKRMKKTHAAPKIRHKKQQKGYRKASMWHIL